MTKVQKRFHLQRPLDEGLMSNLAQTRSIYGIERVSIAPSREELIVEYDASRLGTLEVESALQRAGLPVTGLA